MAHCGLSFHLRQHLPETSRFVASWILLGLSFVNTAHTGPINWQTRRTGTRAEIKAVTYGNGVFVAVGTNGTILRSGDGIFWNFRNNPAEKNFNDVVFGNGFFLATADTGNFDRSEVYTSADGRNWVKRNTDSTNSLTALSFGNGIFVAVAKTLAPGARGVAFSTNGVNWRFINLGDIYSIAFGSNIFVASGDNYRTWRSGDGRTWTSAASFTTPGFATMTYGAGRFVGVRGNGGSAVSFDGINWSLGGGQNIQPVTSVAYGNGVFIVVGGAGNAFAVSSDGLSWMNIAFYPPAKILDITSANGSFIAVGESGLMLQSFNAATWEKRVPGSFCSDIAFGSGVFVGVSGSNIVSSANALEWELRATAAPKTLHDVIFANGIFVSVGDEGTVFTSTDGVTWILRDTGIGNDLLGVAHGNGIFLAVGRQGRAATSVDGVAWTSRYAGRTDNDLISVAFGNEMFLALGHVGRLFTSPNGVDWSNVFQGTAGKRSVAGRSEAFVMAGVSGTILATTDGQVLQTVPSGVTNELKSVTFVNGEFWAVGKEGRILSSSNIVDWLVSIVNTNVDWSDLTHGKSLYVAISENGFVALPATPTNPPSAPVIILEPNSADAPLRGTTQFTVETLSDEPAVFQWFFKGRPIPSATSASLVLTNLRFAAAGTYFVEIGNSVGKVRSEDVQLRVLRPVKIVAQPRSKNVTAGKTMNLRTRSTGSKPLFFQWFKDGEIVAGATSPKFVILNATAGDSGTYSVTVSNSVSSAVSWPATVVVN